MSIDPTSLTAGLSQVSLRAYGNEKEPTKRTFLSSRQDLPGGSVPAFIVPQAPSTELEGAKKPETRADQFLKYMEKTPGERMREQILNSLGYSEEDLKNLTPEERMKVEAKIAYIMEEMLKQKVQQRHASDAPQAPASTAQPAIAPESKDALLQLQEVQPAASVFGEKQKDAA
jgi:hypothetical protein